MPGDEAVVNRRGCCFVLKCFVGAYFVLQVVGLIHALRPTLCDPVLEKHTLSRLLLK